MATIKMSLVEYEHMMANSPELLKLRKDNESLNGQVVSLQQQLMMEQRRRADDEMTRAMSGR